MIRCQHDKGRYHKRQRALAKIRKWSKRFAEHFFAETPISEKLKALFLDREDIPKGEIIVEEFWYPPEK